VERGERERERERERILNPKGKGRDVRMEINEI
jgi:hypothetical protein